MAEDGVGLLFIDLDRFKDVNDTLGHDAGDALLVRVADAMRKLVRGDDLVARLGGDEFAFLLKAPRDLLHSTAMSIGRRILDNLQITIQTATGDIQVGCTVGAAFAPDDAVDAQDLMTCADRLMYAGKKRGRNRLISTADLAEAVV
jgi:diguanylate cyclase (GGDEF)-like protein